MGSPADTRASEAAGRHLQPAFKREQQERCERFQVFLRQRGKTIASFPGKSSASQSPAQTSSSPAKKLDFHVRQRWCCRKEQAYIAWCWFHTCPGAVACTVPLSAACAGAGAVIEQVLLRQWSSEFTAWLSALVCSINDGISHFSVEQAA